MQQVRGLRNQRARRFLRGDSKIRAWGVHAGNSHKSYLVSYRPVTPDPEPTAALGKVRKQRQGTGKANAKAGRKRGFLGGEVGGGREVTSYHLIPRWSLTCEGYTRGCILSI